MRASVTALVAILVLAAVCAAVAIAWLGARSPGSNASPGASPRAVEAPVDPSLRVASTLPPEESRAAVEDAPAAELAETADERRPLAALSGRFVDGRGAVLPGVAVQLADRYGTSPTPEMEQARVESDGSGRFRLELPLPSSRRWRQLRLEARLDGYARLRRDVELSAGEQELGDLVLPDAGEIRGLVLDEGNRPLEGVRVIAFGDGQRDFADELSPPWQVDVETLSAADGRFRLEAVPVGARLVGAGITDRFWSYSEALNVRERDIVRDVVLHLERIPDERRVTLRIVDPTGAPVPHAQVTWRWQLPNRSASGGGQADDEGRYEQLLSETTPYSFVVSDPEERFQPASVSDVPPGTRDLEVRLGELRTLMLVVRDETGEPVEDYGAEAVRTSDGGDWGTLGRTRSRPPYADGRAELVVPGEAFSLRVDAEGFEIATLGPLEPDTAPEALEVSLRRLPGVRGTVLAGDKPIEGAQVGLHKAPGGHLTINGFEARYQLSASPARTDADGRFELTLRESGTFWIRAEAEGLAPADVGPLELDPSVGRDGLLLALGPGGAIEGRVIVPLGEAALGTVVGVSRADGNAVTQRADAQGRFRFERLTPGPWLVAGADEEITPNRTSTSMSTGKTAELRFNCQVVEGQTTHFDLDLTRGPAVVLEGRLTLSGVPASGWKATLSPEGGGKDRDVRLDEDGRFTLTSERVGAHSLDLVLGEGVKWRATLSTSLDLPYGTTPWTLDLPVGSLRGRAPASPDPEARSGLATWAEGDLRFYAQLEFAPDGAYALPLLPAGEVVLRRAEFGTTVRLGQPTIVAGQENVLDLP